MKLTRLFKLYMLTFLTVPLKFKRKSINLFHEIKTVFCKIGAKFSVMETSEQ
jgi:hypothetical protein